MYTFTVDSASAQNIFVVQLYDANNKWVNAGSYGEVWGDVTADGTLSTLNYDEVEAGETWNVRIARSGNELIIQYYEVDTETVFATYTVDATDLEDTLNVRVAAQYGTYDVTFEEATETLTGTGWWTWADGTVSEEKVMEGDGTWRYTITVDSASTQNIFVVQLHDENNKWVNAGSYGEVWGDVTVSGTLSTLNYDAVEAGEIWTVSITRSGDELTIKYYEVETATVFATYTVDATNLGDTLNARIAAQYGTYSTFFSKVNIIY